VGVQWQEWGQPSPVDDETIRADWSSWVYVFGLGLAFVVGFVAGRV